MRDNLSQEVDIAASRTRPFNWRQEYLHLTVLAMTASWLTAWVALSLNWFLEISLANVLGLTAFHLFSSAVIVRVMLHYRARMGLVVSTISLLMWLAAGVTLLLLPTLARAYGDGDQLTLAELFHVDRYARLPAGPVVILWVLLLWGRGLQLTSIYMTHTRASFGMRLGLLSFVWVALLARPSLRSDIMALLPPFFFFGLLSSSLARADSLHLDRAGTNRAFGRGWMPALTVIALLLTFGGYMVALWLAGINIAQFGNALRVLAEGIVTLVFIVFSPLLLLGQIAYDFLISVMPDRFSQPYEATGTGGEEAANSNLPVPWIGDVFALLTDALIIMALVFIVLAISAFLWYLFLARRVHDEYDDEEREPLGTGEVVANLRQSLRDGWRRLADTLGFLRQFGLGRDLFAALTIRRIYARMEKLAGARGYPRAAAETPYEYRQVLQQAFPDNISDTQRITEAYVMVRYGEVPEDPAELQAVRAAWEHLQHSPEADPSI